MSPESLGLSMFLAHLAKRSSASFPTSQDPAVLWAMQDLYHPSVMQLIPVHSKEVAKTELCVNQGPLGTPVSSRSFEFQWLPHSEHLPHTGVRPWGIASSSPSLSIFIVWMTGIKTLPKGSILLLISQFHTISLGWNLMLQTHTVLFSFFHLTGSLFSKKRLFRVHSYLSPPFWLWSVGLYNSQREGLSFQIQGLPVEESTHWRFLPDCQPLS